MNNLLTASRTDALLSCPRKHFWAYEVGLRHSTDANALRLGKSWHLAMEPRWKGEPFEAALAKAIPDGVNLDELQIATLGGLLAGYYANYGNEEALASIQPEIKFESALAGSRTFAVAGKIDGLGQLKDGRLALIESKTTSDSIDAASDYWLRLRFNSQVFQYVLAARGMGWDVAAVIYDVTRKPAIEPKQIPQLDEQDRKIVLDAAGQRVFKKDGSPRESGDTEKGYVLQSTVETPEQFGQRLAEDTRTRPEFYFARREVPILEQDLAEFEAQRLTLSRLILHCRQAEKRMTRREQAWPRNISAFGCKGCSFNTFCLQNISIDLNSPPTGFQITDPNPELKETA